jgi:hypothetical protein
MGESERESGRLAEVRYMFILIILIILGRI